MCEADEENNQNEQTEYPASAMHVLCTVHCVLYMGTYHCGKDKQRSINHVLATLQAFFIRDCDTLAKSAVPAI